MPKLKRVAPQPPPPGNERLDRLRGMVAELNREKGLPDWAKIRFADQAPGLERMSTGILTLDMVMGGGLPRARMTQYKGPESCFKTSGLFHSIAAAQARGETAALVFSEEFDRAWAARLGVRLGELALVPGLGRGDDALERASKMVESGDLDLLAIDSVQTVESVREAKNEIGEGGFGDGTPQMWGQFAKRMYRCFNMGARTAVLWISQYRTQVGKWSPTGDASDGTQIWGLKHAKSIDVRWKKTEIYRDGKDGPIYARDFSITADKNKTSKPHETGTFRFYFTDHGGIPFGVDHARDAAQWGITTGVIEAKGAWYTLPSGERLNGQDGLSAYLRQNPEELQALRDLVLQTLG